MLLKNALILISIVTLAGCATASRDIKYADGTQSHLFIFEMGRTEAISQLNAYESSDSSGLSVGTANADVNVKAIDSAAGALGNIVGTALKAYTGKP